MGNTMSGDELFLGINKAKEYLDLEVPIRTPADNALTAQQLAAYLIRTNYVKEVGKLIPPAWVALEESALTNMLSKHFSEVQLEALFIEKAELRQLLKNRARNFSLISAVAIALIWCREDLDSGSYWMVGAKFSATAGGAYLMNRYFYGRDKTAIRIMQRNMGNFGKWFQGCARTNATVNFLARRLVPAMLIWDLRTFLMSSGPDGPNIPFDFIIEIDIFSSSVWPKPPQTGLDMGMDYFYYQEPDPLWQIGRQQLCLGVVRGSIIRGIKRRIGF